MFEQIRDDYRIHGSSLRNRAFWHMVVYRYGIWSMSLRSAPLRWFTSKIYGLASIVSTIVTGIDMDRTVKVGKGFHLVHPGAINIHPTAVIGDRCGIMHGVTIGTNMGDRAPVIGNDVFIGCGSSVLGSIKIGDGVRIAANTLVITDVPPHSIAMGVPAKIMPDLRARLSKAKSGNRAAEVSAAK